jgi:hypothetical protein
VIILSLCAEGAQWGRSSLGWRYGFKLHLLINDIGELMACRLTAANVDDRVPVPGLLKGVLGKVFGDWGYISQALFEDLFPQGVNSLPPLPVRTRLTQVTIMSKDDFIV